MVTPLKKKPTLAVVERMTWWRSALTDRQGEFDTGRILVPIGVLAMIVLSGIDVYVNKAHFDPQQFGIGMGALLAGFAAYLWGDAKNTPSTVTTVQATTTTK